MKKIKFYKEGESNNNLTVVYLEKDDGFITEPNVGTDFTLMTGGAYLGIDVTLYNNEVVSVSGYIPKNLWIYKKIEPPKILYNAQIFIESKLELKSGTGTNLKKSSKIYYNTENNWICIGNPNKKKYDNTIKFMQNAIMCLKNNEFEALWINLIQK